MLKINSLEYKYEDGTRALKGINMDLNRGNIIGLIGANGSGKSTLFLNILGILRPSKGKIEYKGKPIKYKKKDLINYRKEVNLVFQNPEKQIFYSNIRDDIAFSLRNLNYDEREVERRVVKALKKVKALDLIERPAHFLSYGQKKRIAIASILVLDTKVLLLDEPTAGLDPEMTREMMEIIKSLTKDRKILIASHDMDFIYQICDYIYLLKEGEILGEGRAEEVFLESKLLEEAGLDRPWLVKVHKRLGLPLYKTESEFEKNWKGDRNEKGNNSC